MRGPFNVALLAWLLGCTADPALATAGGSGSGSSTSASSTTAGPGSATGPGLDTGSSTDPDPTTTSAETTSSTPFEHEWFTLLTDDGRLALHSNLPPSVDECLGLVQAPCDDLDADGLVDAWEDAVLDRLRPLRRFDEAEAALDDPAAVFADVGRVFAVGEGVYRMMAMLGYSRDYGSCGGFTAHDGDSERVALELWAWPAEGVGGVVMQRAYTAAHEGTINDHGQLFASEDLAALVFTPDPDTGQPRWVVFPSADKHATYATVEICEGISPLPCVDEDCGPDGVADPAAFDRLPPAGNAGEADAPRLTDLGPLGFAGEDAWADQEFCGGLAGPSCSSSVRSKLLGDPFL